MNCMFLSLIFHLSFRLFLTRGQWNVFAIFLSFRWFCVDLYIIVYLVFLLNLAEWWLLCITEVMHLDSLISSSFQSNSLCHRIFSFSSSLEYCLSLASGEYNLQFKYHLSMGVFFPFLFLELLKRFRHLPEFFFLQLWISNVHIHIYF